MLVEVRPIERKKWHGKSEQENFSQPVVLECPYDTQTGKYATGLSEDERKKLEKDTGYDLSDEFTNEPHPFWNSSIAKIKLPARTVVFNTTKPLDFIKVKVLKANKLVANSLKEYREGKYPDAEFFIYDEQEEAELKASKIQKKRKATQMAIKMSSDEKVNIIQIMSDKSMRGQSQNFLDVEIDKLIEDDLDKFLIYAKANKNELYIRATLLEGIHRNILTKEGNNVLYMGDVIGITIDEAVKYFLDPQNQKIKASILEKLSV